MAEERESAKKEYDDAPLVKPSGRPAPVPTLVLIYGLAKGRTLTAVNLRPSECITKAADEEGRRISEGPLFLTRRFARGCMCLRVRMADRRGKARPGETRTQAATTPVCSQPASGRKGIHAPLLSLLHKPRDGMYFCRRRQRVRHRWDPLLPSRGRIQRVALFHSAVVARPSTGNERPSSEEDEGHC